MADTNPIPTFARHLAPGQVYNDRNGNPLCRIISLDAKGFQASRLKSGKPIRVTWRMVRETAARLLAGETPGVHANRSKGGIDYTTAKEMGVVFALGKAIQLATGGKAWTLADSGQATLEQVA